MPGMWCRPVAAAAAVATVKTTVRPGAGGLSDRKCNRKCKKMSSWETKWRQVTQQRGNERVAAVSRVYVRPVRVKAEPLSSLQISELLKREHESPFDTASFFTHCVKFLFFLILFTFWRPSLCSGCGKVSRNGEVIHHQQLPPPQHTHTHHNYPNPPPPPSMLSLQARQDCRTAACPTSSSSALPTEQELE